MSKRTAPKNIDKIIDKEIMVTACNPIYAGIPPYPQIISDYKWIKCAAIIIEEIGVERFLVKMLLLLRKSMDTAYDIQMEKEINNLVFGKKEG